MMRVFSCLGLLIQEAGNHVNHLLWNPLLLGLEIALDKM